MSISTEGVSVPEWDQADRLTKALRVAEMSVQDMADYLEVHRNTISAWINGRTPIGSQSLRLWALRTGVPYEWLKDGKQAPTPDTDPDGGEVISTDQPTGMRRQPPYAAPIIELRPTG